MAKNDTRCTALGIGVSWSFLGANANNVCPLCCLPFIAPPATPIHMHNVAGMIFLSPGTAVKQNDVFNVWMIMIAVIHNRQVIFQSNALEVLYNILLY